MSNKDSIIEPLRNEMESLREEIRQLRELVDQLRSENKRLKEKLAASKKNSRNSSKPPSSDIVKPKKPETSENGGKRKPGGQPGHPKHTRALFTEDHIDQSHPHGGSEAQLAGNPRFPASSHWKYCAYSSKWP